MFVIVTLPAVSYGADLNGLQPPSPYGVFSTFATSSPQKGQVAIEGSFETLLGSSFSRYASNIAYGISDKVEISVSVSDQNEGFEDIAFGLKHRFLDKGPYGPSLAYLVTGAFESGSDELSPGGSYGGGFILSDRVGPVRAHVNLLYMLPGDSRFQGEFRGSAGLVFAAAHNKWLLGEIYARSSHFSEEIDQFETRLGYRVLLADNVYADLGMGVDFRQNPTDYRFIASLAFVYPRPEKKIRRIYEGM